MYKWLFVLQVSREREHRSPVLQYSSSTQGKWSEDVCPTWRQTHSWHWNGMAEAGEMWAWTRSSTQRWTHQVHTDLVMCLSHGFMNPMPGVGYVVWSLVENLKIHLNKCTKCDRNLWNGTYLHVNIWLTWFQYDLNFKVFHPMNYLFCAILKARETWTAGKKVFPKGNYDCCMLLLLFCLQVYSVIKSNYEWLIFILLFFKWLEIQFYKQQ